MSTEFAARSMDVIQLATGRYAVRIIAAEALARTVGDFETREEADAWVLQAGLSEDESVLGGHLMQPGPSLDVS